tara:strand:+ start:134 stop:310 length:177 start_codon:yes stop_codon:yes gene_type:complete
MTTIAYNLIASPFAGLGKKIMEKCEIIGYARAAAHLATHGYHEEAKRCMLQHNKLKNG